MMEIIFPAWFILVGIISYVAFVYTFAEWRKKRDAVEREKYQEARKHFNWLTSIGLHETRRNFNKHGQHCQWWDIKNAKD